MELIYILLAIIILLLTFIILKQFYPNFLKKIKHSFADSNDNTDNTEKDDDIMANIILGVFIICMGIFTIYNLIK